MSAFHHMGKLVSINDEWATYQYYPDFISHESVFGTFKVKPSSLVGEGNREFEIISRAQEIRLFGNRPQEHVVFALLSKIKKSAIDGEYFPKEVYHIA